MLNIQALIPVNNNSKLMYLKHIANEENAAIIAISETHLNQTHSFADTHLDNYNTFRSDRKDRTKGGVLTFIRQDLGVTQESAYCNQFCENMKLYIPKINLCLVNTYRPPKCKTSHFKENMSNIDSWLQKFNCNNTQAVPYTILLGDFNFPQMESWEDNAVSKLLSQEDEKLGSENRQAKLLAILAEDYALTQRVMEPTRTKNRQTNEGNILDILFTNSDHIVNNIKTYENSVISDHKTVVGNLNLEISKQKIKPMKNHCTTKLRRFKIHTATPEQMAKINNNLENADWSGYYTKTLDEMYNTIVRNLEEAVAKELEDKEAKKKNEEGKTPRSKSFIPKEFRILFRQKKKINRKLRNPKQVNKWRQLQRDLADTENKIRHLSTKTKAQAEEKLFEEMKINKQVFYRYVKSKNKLKQHIGPFTQDGKQTNEKECEILAKQYQSVFTIPMEEYKIKSEEFFKIDEEEVEDSNSKLTQILLTPTKIMEAIVGMKGDTAPGPDGICARLLKGTREALNIPLFFLYKKSLEESQVPTSFKYSHIIPILKPGCNASKPASFRPISLTSNLCKILERIIRAQIIEFLESNSLLHHGQHGFRRGRSCVTQLMEHYDNIVTALESGQNLDVVLLDYAKAFDCLDFGVLLHAMKSKKIQGPVLKWLYHFMTGRKQCVIANGEISEPVEVMSGTPQGSILGPLLFLIHIDSSMSIPEDTETEENEQTNEPANNQTSKKRQKKKFLSYTLIFADDTKVAVTIEDEQDAQKLQQKLEKIYKWAEDQNMLYNQTKFRCLKIGFNQDLKEQYNYMTPNASGAIEDVDHVKDLGIIMSADATFNAHITEVRRKVKMKAAWALRSFECRGPLFMRFLWTSYIRPHIDYGSPLWYPIQDNAKILYIENLQRQFLKCIPYYKNLSYWDILKRINLTSIQRRIERYLCIYTWRCAENIITDKSIKQYVHPYNGRLCNIPPLAMGYRNKARALRENSFQVKGPRCFNALPQYLRNMTGVTTATFKKNLDKFLEELPDTPFCPGYTPQATCQMNSSPSNSIIDWMKKIRVEGRSIMVIESEEEEEGENEGYEGKTEAECYRWLEENEKTEEDCYNWLHQ